MKASLVEVTVPSTSLKKVPILLKASLVVSTLATATRKTATLLRTKEWKHKRRFIAGKARHTQAVDRG